MNRIVLEGYIVISVMIAITDILLAIQSVKKNKTTGRFLGLACAAAALVDISYLIICLGDCIYDLLLLKIYFFSVSFDDPVVFHVFSPLFFYSYGSASCRFFRQISHVQTHFRYPVIIIADSFSKWNPFFAKC